jgi:hypothetical protein
MLSYSSCVAAVLRPRNSAERSGQQCSAPATLRSGADSSAPPPHLCGADCSAPPPQLCGADCSAPPPHLCGSDSSYAHGGEARGQLFYFALRSNAAALLNKQ